MLATLELLVEGDPAVELLLAVDLGGELVDLAALLAAIEAEDAKAQGFLCMVGEATHEETLKAAGIARAKVLERAGRPPRAHREVVKVETNRTRLYAALISIAAALLLLAAGGSRRLGQPKQLLTQQGSTGPQAAASMVPG